MIYLLFKAGYWSPLLLLHCFLVLSLNLLVLALHYLGTVMLSVWIFKKLYPLIGLLPLSLYNRHSLSLVTVCGLKSILCDISIATPASFWFPFTCNISFQPFTFRLCVLLKLKSLLGRQNIVGLVFLSFWPLNMFSLKNLVHFYIVTDRYRPNIVIYFIVFWLFCIPFVPLFFSVLFVIWISIVVCLDSY